MVASWISGENAAHPSSSSTTWYPRSAASRAVVSTQTLVTTPPTTRDEMPSAQPVVETRRAERVVRRLVHDELARLRLEAPHDASPGVGPRWDGGVSHRRAVGRVALPEDGHKVATVGQLRGHRRVHDAQATSSKDVEKPTQRRLDHSTATLLEVAQHARNDGLAGQRERRGGIQ